MTNYSADLESLIHSDPSGTPLELPCKSFSSPLRPADQSAKKTSKQFLLFSPPQTRMLFRALPSRCLCSYLIAAEANAELAFQTQDKNMHSTVLRLGDKHVCSTPRLRTPHRRASPYIRARIACSHPPSHAPIPQTTQPRARGAHPGREKTRGTENSRRWHCAAVGARAPVSLLTDWYASRLAHRDLRRVAVSHRARGILPQKRRRRTAAPLRT